MMFLVIFSSLAAAMAIVAQGNMTTADTHQKANRAAATAETGLRFMVYRLNVAVASVKTRDGVINGVNAPDLWTSVRDGMLAAMLDNAHNIAEPTVVDGMLNVGPIAVGPDDPAFSATLTPHPLAGENYGSTYYQRPPYSQLSPPVSAINALDATWIRLRVQATDGDISRSIQVDFHMDKKIPFAILSKSRVMIGRHVLIDGPVGSRFTETSLAGGHPIQMVSDFSGLNATLDASLASFAALCNTNDQNGDNRIALASSAETEGIEDAVSFDLNSDGYIDDYDFFLGAFDANADNIVSSTELAADSNINTAQLLQLIDTFGDPSRYGYNDGKIDDNDKYAKLRGQIDLLAAFEGWNEGAAGGMIQNYYRGPVVPDHGKNALTFESSNVDQHDYTPSDFDVSSFKTMATGNLVAQVDTQLALYDPGDPASPKPISATFEAAPYGAAHPYDYYTRPVYENMTFTNVTIPKGTNALFRNCKFIGVTFVETTTTNTDTNFNLAGTVGADGTAVFPGSAAVVNGSAYTDTKPLSNNLRFDDCTFEGGVVSDVPSQFTQVRNKITFTGTTRFNIDSSPSLSADQKTLFKRSTIFTPHYSVELGTFDAPADPNETVELSGTIVAGVIDIRGQATVDGTILTTFAPTSNTLPVIGDTSPQFNTTLGYFASLDGDLESELPDNGAGMIHVTYNSTLPLPDGILGPIQVNAVMASYTEGY